MHKNTSDIVKNLVIMSGLSGNSGYKLFMDNYYTTLKVIRMLYEQFKWLACGTVAMKKKKKKDSSIVADDYPWRKMTKGAISFLRRGFFRIATRSFYTASNSKYVVQATMWKDRKMVGWLHTVAVNSGKVEAKRRSKRRKFRQTFDAPNIQSEYAKGYRGVDISDQDGSFWSISLRTCRWYLRLFFWMVEKDIHGIYVVVCYIVTETYKPFLKRYKSKNNGRKKFAVHMGIALMNSAITMEWKRRDDGEYHDEDKPKWMPQNNKNGKYQPCECGLCFFCINTITYGIAHGKVSARPKVYECSMKREQLPTRTDCVICNENSKKQYPDKGVHKRRKLCKHIRTNQGCLHCGDAVCQKHWDSKEYKHKWERTTDSSSHDVDEPTD